MPCVVGIVHLGMHLLLDIGNTSIKFAISDGRNLEATGQIDAADILELVQSMNLEGVAISATGAIPTVINDLPNCFVVSAKVKLPFTNGYESDSVGADRLALMAGAQQVYPKSNVAVLDFGTCLTTDVILEDGTYIGGSISPGIQMRLDAMHERTENLPQFINGNDENIPLIAKDTEGCMRSGAVNGIAMEARGVIQELQSRYNNLITVVTGGNYAVLDVDPKNNIFADANLLLKGLDVIFLLNRSA